MTQATRRANRAAGQLVNVHRSRSPLGRLLPEVCAGIAYLMVPLAGMLFRGSFLANGYAWAYLSGALLLMTLPVGETARWLHAQQRSGTLEALMLTSADRSRLVWGWHWHLMRRWARLVVWLLPLFAICLVTRPKVSFGYWDGGATANAMTVTSATCPPVALAGWFVLGREFHWLGPGYIHLIVLVRLVCDMIGLMLTISLTLWLASRLGPNRSAMLTCLLVVPLAVVLGAGFLRTLTIVYWVPLSLAAEVLLSIHLLRNLGKRFDRLALIE